MGWEALRNEVLLELLKKRNDIVNYLLYARSYGDLFHFVTIYELVINRLKQKLCG